MMMNVEKILFFKPGAIGDFLQAIPTLRQLRIQYPKAHVDIVISPGLESLIRGTDLADEILLYDITRFRKSYRNFIRFGLLLRKEQYDLFVDMQSSTRSFAIREISGAKRILFFRKQKKVRPGERRLHAAENFLETLLPLGTISSVDRIELPLASDIVQTTTRFLQEQGIERSKPLIALNCSVGAARPARNWFPEKFGELADKLIHDRGAAVVFIGGREDTELVKSVVSGMKEKALSVAGELSLERTAALLAQCVCLVSSDTGPLHLATAVNTPVVGLYGSTDPRRTGPVGPGHTVIIKKLSCVPCEEKKCRFGTRQCMAEISVAEVYESIGKRLDGTGIDFKGK